MTGERTWSGRLGDCPASEVSLGLRSGSQVPFADDWIVEKRRIYDNGTKMALVLVTYSHASSCARQNTTLIDLDLHARQISSSSLEDSNWHLFLRSSTSSVVSTIGVLSDPIGSAYLMSHIDYAEKNQSNQA